jgi:hypothetical protein
VTHQAQRAEGLEGPAVRLAVVRGPSAEGVPGPTATVTLLSFGIGRARERHRWGNGSGGLSIELTTWHGFASA